jgi:hypothetical protein
MSKVSIDEILNSLKTEKPSWTHKYPTYTNEGSKKTFPKGYCAEIGKRSDWWSEEQGPNIYLDILEYCLRKEFDEKLQKQQEEIDTLKKALTDTLAALATK